MSRKKRVNQDVIKIISDCSKKIIGISEAARQAGVDPTTMERWVMQYEDEGIAAFTYESNKTYSTDQKLKAITDYLSGKGSLMDICRKHKIRSKSILNKWIMVYNSNGDLGRIKSSGGGSYMKEGRDTTYKERIQIAKECIENGKNYGEIALKNKVSYQQARTWTNRYIELGEKGLEDRRGKRKKDQIPRTELEKAQIEIEQLKHKLYITEMERDLLKKLEEVERRDVFHK